VKGGKRKRAMKEGGEGEKGREKREGKSDRAPTDVSEVGACGWRKCPEFCAV